MNFKNALKALTCALLVALILLLIVTCVTVNALITIMCVTGFVVLGSFVVFYKYFERKDNE